MKRTKLRLLHEFEASFVAIGDGGPKDASDRVDEYVACAVRRHRRCSSSIQDRWSLLRRATPTRSGSSD